MLRIIHDDNKPETPPERTVRYGRAETRNQKPDPSDAADRSG
jgi:hypothetical protein